MNINNDMQGVLSVLQRAQAANGIVEAKSAEMAGTPHSEFADDLLKAIRSVSESQLQAADLKERYEAGGEVSLTDILVDSQKASVAFEATLQVRNKILKAYQDVMSMPV
jgi:flagellar hook-basal body complex protein FliE